MKNVLVVGAGSIGIHLTQACRRAGHDVTIVDVSDDALARLPDIYRQRYGAWDEAVRYENASTLLRQKPGFDWVFIGTPPDTHVALAKQYAPFYPELLHIEKPLCRPGDDFAVFEALADEDTILTVGYDHAVAKSTRKLVELVREKKFGEVVSIDAFTYESWNGIMKAHPWLAGPHETYLGYFERGGGALCEHSHALHLGMLFAKEAGFGPLEFVSGAADIVSGPHGERYDRVGRLLMKGSDGRILAVGQDVVTTPTMKGVRIIAERGRLDLSFSPSMDTILVYGEDGAECERHEFPKKRPDDFYELVLHYEQLTAGSGEASPLTVDTGVAVMEMIAKVLR